MALKVNNTMKVENHSQVKTLSLEDTIFKEIVKSLYMALPSALMAAVIIALSLVMILWQEIDTFMLTAWFVTLVSTILCRFIAYKFYLKSEKNIDDIYFWDRVFYILLIFTSITWSSVSIFLLPSSESIYHYLPVLILIGISAGSITSLGFKFRNIATYFLFLLIPVLITEILIGTFLSYIIAFLTIVFIGLALSSSKRITQALIENMRLRYEAEARERELVESKNIAIAANNAKSNFISLISHELRTPLNAILGYSQLLKMSDTPALNEEQDEQNRGITDSGKHLLSLIEELLDLSEIEANQISISIEEVSLQSALAESISILTPVAAELQSEIINEVENKYRVKADPKRLKQIFINLISNAIKYNHLQGKIVISAENTADGFIRVSVNDDGNGLTEDQQHELFQAFKRFDKKQAGIGLGLFITKKLVDLMGGKIGVTSEISKGSTFWFDLVLAE